MKPELVSLPAPRGGYLELARTKQGRWFRGQILHVGDSFVHPSAPGTKIKVTPEMGKSLQDNFRAGYCDIVQVPIVDDGNKHVENPERNIGEVVDIQVDNKGVYAIIDARKASAADELGKTLIGASAMMHLNYGDSRTGKKVGPTLLHVAVTNRPYITNLDGYEEIIAASADTAGDEPVFFTPAETKETSMELDEMLEALKAEHGIDVEALQGEVASLSAALEEAPAAPEADTEAVTAELLAAFSGVLNTTGIVALSADDLTIESVASAVVELARNNTELATTVADLKATNDELALSAAETEVDKLVSVGRVLPTQRDAMIELSMTNREMFDRLLPEKAIVSLSEDGVTVHDGRESEGAPADDEITRLSAVAATIQAGSGRKKG